MASYRRCCQPVVIAITIVLIHSLIALTVESSSSRSGSGRTNWRLTRRSYCVGSAGKCFATGQCCDGLICAAFDDYFGQKPEVPGYCVKEKDLRACAVNADCSGGTRCVALGQTGERYCLPKYEQTGEGGISISSPAVEEARSVKLQAALTKLHGLGADCETNADCKTSTDTSNELLCCQNVRRGKQGVRRICDRVTTISVCIAE